MANLSVSPEGVLQEEGGESQGCGIDAVSGALADMPLDGYVVPAERVHGAVQHGEGNNLVGIAVTQEDRRSADDLPAKTLFLDQHAGKSRHGSDRLPSTQRHVERHHATLAESQKGKRPVVKAEAFEFRIDPGVDHVAGPVDSLPCAFGVLLHQGVPLATGRVLVTTVGSIGAADPGLGKGRLQGPGKTDQVIAVRAPAMQQHDKLACFTPAGRHGRS